MPIGISCSCVPVLVENAYECESKHVENGIRVGLVETAQVVAEVEKFLQGLLSRKRGGGEDRGLECSHILQLFLGREL